MSLMHGGAEGEAGGGRDRSFSLPEAEMERGYRSDADDAGRAGYASGAGGGAGSGGGRRTGGSSGEGSGGSFDRETIAAAMEFSMRVAQSSARRGALPVAEGLPPEADEPPTLVQRLAKATHLRRAAAHALLLRDDRAAALFAHAVDAYADAGLPYALMMRACTTARFARELPLDAGGWLELHAAANRAAGESRAEPPRFPGPPDGGGLDWGALEDREPRRESYADTPPSLLPQLAYVLLAASAAGREEDDALRVELEGHRSRALGLLPMPVGAYLDLAAALDEEGDGGGRMTRGATFPFVAAYDGAVRTASRRGEHWRSASMPFHPAEPDVVAVLRLADPAAVWTREWLAGLPLADASRTLLADALGTYESDEGDESVGGADDLVFS